MSAPQARKDDGECKAESTLNASLKPEVKHESLIWINHPDALSI
jgi:hypothetical protein